MVAFKTGQTDPLDPGPHPHPRLPDLPSAKEEGDGDIVQDGLPRKQCITLEEIA
jgi:hypothetical protein